MLKKKTKKAKRLQIRTKNASANPLRGDIIVPVRTILRLGSTTPTNEIFPTGVRLGSKIIEINKPQGCITSGNKILMKQAFIAHNVKTAPFMTLTSAEEWEEKANNDGFKPYPAIIKRRDSSQGRGIYMINNREDADRFVNEHADLAKHIIEKYYTFSREYRLHVTKEGCFYTCRKMLKNEAEERWHRHDDNSVWILENNEQFNKPSNWDEIVEECIKAMNSVGLDLCACDVKTSKENREGNVDFIILETNSAPALGEIGINAYREYLPGFVQRLNQEPVVVEHNGGGVI